MQRQYPNNAMSAVRVEPEPAQRTTETVAQLLAEHEIFGLIAEIEQRFLHELEDDSARLVVEGVLTEEQHRTLADGRLWTDPAVRALLDEQGLAPTLLPLIFRDNELLPWTLTREIDAYQPSESAFRETESFGLPRVLRPGAGPLHSHVGSCLQQFVQAELPDHPVRLIDPSDEVVAGLTDSAELLATALPELGAQTLRAARMIGIIDGASVLPSTQLLTVPGTLFLDGEWLRDPVRGAELLFHEALHQKLDMLQRTAGVYLKPPTQIEREQRVTAVWHINADASNRRWPAMRVLAAFHVYAHLVALADGLAEIGGYKRQAADLHARALFRAQYLGHAFRRGQLSTLGTPATNLVELLSILPNGTFGPVEQYLIDHGWHEDNDAGPA